jgi:hypothetical protein
LTFFVLDNELALAGTQLERHPQKKNKIPGLARDKLRTIVLV